MKLASECYDLWCDLAVQYFWNDDLLSSIISGYFGVELGDMFKLSRISRGWSIVFHFLVTITSKACIVISGLELIFHWESYSVIVVKSYFISLAELLVPWITTPSAKCLKFEDKSACKSLMSITNNKGHNIEPYRIPEFTRVKENVCSFTINQGKRFKGIYLISPKQSGFKSNQLIFILHIIYESLGAGHVLRGVSFDVSKAFAKVWH